MGVLRHVAAIGDSYGEHSCNTFCITPGLEGERVAEIAWSWSKRATNWTVAESLRTMATRAAVCAIECTAFRD